LTTLQHAGHSQEDIQSAQLRQQYRPLPVLLDGKTEWRGDDGDAVVPDLMDKGDRLVAVILLLYEVTGMGMHEPQGRIGGLCMCHLHGSRLSICCCHANAFQMTAPDTP
jgi:hypothetical protein